MGNIGLTAHEMVGGFPGIFSLFFIALTIGIGASGYFYYKNQEKQLRDVANDQLNAVVDLKGKQLVAWPNEWIADIIVILKNKIVFSFVRQYLDNPADSIF